MIYWNDVDEVRPEKGQWIFYLDPKTVDWCKSQGFKQVCIADIDKGCYMGDNLAEYHYDLPCEVFKYWYPVPEIK